MNTLRHVWRYADLVSQRSRKSVPRQISEILRLRFGPHRIGLTEYYELELFDDSLYDWTAKGRFVGHRYSSHIDRVLNADAWRAVAYDKVVNYLVLQHLGLPIPQTVAIFNEFGRRIHHEPGFATTDTLFHFLETQRPYPLFAKPIHGYSGVAAYGIREIDFKSASIELINGNRIDLSTFARDLEFAPYGGMLFQVLLTPPAGITRAFGERLSTFRLIVLLTDSGPKMHMAFWKIARHRNMTDNFSFGALGNMLGWIHSENGTVERVIKGLWPENAEIIDHPDTGARIKGFQIPDWNGVRDLCLSAAVHFPGLRIQSWDVALCEDGPVLLELNTDADLEIPQAIGRKPFLDDTLLALLPSH